MFVPILALSVILAVVMLAAAVPKLLGQAEMRDRMTALGVSAGLTRIIAILEIVGVAGLVIGLFWWPLGVAAAVGLALLMLGAAGYHARAKDPIQTTVVPVVLAVAAGAIAVLHVLNA